MRQRVLSLSTGHGPNLFKCDKPLTRSCLHGTAYISRRGYASRTAEQATKRADQNIDPVHISYPAQRAKAKQADKELFIDLLSSAATKRDAKAYISRLKDESKSSSRLPSKTRRTTAGPNAQLSEPQVNLGSFFGKARAVDNSPTFSQYAEPEKSMDEAMTVHIALVKLVSPELLDEQTLKGIGQTLFQLSRLSMSPCVVLDTTNLMKTAGEDWMSKIREQVERVAAAIETHVGATAVRLESIFQIEPNSQPEVVLRNLLLKPLRRGQIPVIGSVAHLSSNQLACQVTADNIILALTKEFVGLNDRTLPDKNTGEETKKVESLQKQVSLDRLIILDPEGGIPISGKPGHKHVFVNLEEEFESIRSGLSSSSHSQILDLLRSVLSLLPASSSALVTTPLDAAKSGDASTNALQVSSVGTRRQRNALIHNLLTDKPPHSSSLPIGRLGLSNGKTLPPVTSTPTFVKRGMPLIILPNPTQTSWVPGNHGQPRLKLTDPRIDLPKLVHLINDSFNRQLDVEHYLNRVKDSMAGVIIAGDYEGGALLTWETPRNAFNEDAHVPESRLVPYLDKFAVLKRSQGAGGVADILFNAMVQKCFPDGVCWRSRRDNPVNKWYFERAKGTWKMPDTNWTMFWTTEGVVENDQTFRDYESVCRGVEPSWADNKQIVD